MREKRIEKEIKKAQKKGIYNPKLKLGIVGLILVIGTVIGVSYAYYTKTATNTLTIEGTVSKKITVNVKANNGSVMDGSLARAILNNNSVKDGTPNFSVGCPLSDGDACSGLYKTNDDDGETYYFRGNVDNYVQFGKDSSGKDLLWRIVRINGDKTIRLIYNGTINSSMNYNSPGNAKKYVGYTFDNKSACTNDKPCTSKYENNQFTMEPSGTDSTIKKELEKWYKQNLNSYDNYIAYGTFCNDVSQTTHATTSTDDNSTNETIYGPYGRIAVNQSPSLKCPSQPTNRFYGGVYKLKIGLISADEMMYGGIKFNSKISSNNYLNQINSSMWTISPCSGNTNALAFWQYSTSYGLQFNVTTLTAAAIPVINLKENVPITDKAGQNGSKDHPFEIKQEGNINSDAQTVDYGDKSTFTVIPDTGYKYKSVKCIEDGGDTRDVTGTDEATYNESTKTLTVTPRTSQNATCTVEFGEAIEIFGHKYFVKENPSASDFAKGCPTSGDTECSGLYKMEDDKGTSYYFRGEANNYVKFGTGTTSNNQSKHDLMWRIVRINGDGSIRLVLDSDIGLSTFNNSSGQRKYAGYTYDNDSPCTNSSPCTSTYNNNQFTMTPSGTGSTIQGVLEDWYKENLSGYDSQIELGVYCNDTPYGSGDETGTLYYGAYQRSQNATPQLTCPDPKAKSGTQSSDDVDSNGNHTYGGVYKLKIGLLSGDEIVLAGFKPTSGSGVTSSNYLNYTPSSNFWFWSSSPNDSNTRYAFGFSGLLNYRYLYSGYRVNDSTGGVRPVINLKDGTQISSGDGSSDKPFVIKN